MSQTLLRFTVADSMPSCLGRWPHLAHQLMASSAVAQLMLHSSSAEQVPKHGPIFIQVLLVAWVLEKKHELS